MRVHSLLTLLFLGGFAAPAQDWQACKPVGDYSFQQRESGGAQGDEFSDVFRVG